MFKVVNGDMFQSECIVKTNPTNSVGVMGKGLALTFKKLYPKECDSFNDYSLSYQANFRRLSLIPPILYSGINVLMFPTKVHWKNPSELKYISINSKAARLLLEEYNSPSIAMPALGCGLGGLDFKKVIDILEKEFYGYSADVEVYAPNV